MVPTSPLYSSPLPDRQAGYQGEGNRQSLVTMKVDDDLEKEVAICFKEEKHSGHYEVEFFAEDLLSSVYYYQLRVANFVQTNKMIYLK